MSKTDTDNERSPEEESILFKGHEETGQLPLSIPLQAFVLQPLHLAKDARLMRLSSMQSDGRVRIKEQAELGATGRGKEQVMGQ